MAKLEGPLGPLDGEEFVDFFRRRDREAPPITGIPQKAQDLDQVSPPLDVHGCVERALASCGEKPQD